MTVKPLVTTWLSHQEEKLQNKLLSWMDDFFYRALDFVMDLDALVVDTTKVLMSPSRSSSPLSSLLYFLISSLCACAEPLDVCVYSCRTL